MSPLEGHPFQAGPEAVRLLQVAPQTRKLCIFVLARRFERLLFQTPALPALSLLC